MFQHLTTNDSTNAIEYTLKNCRIKKKLDFDVKRTRWQRYYIQITGYLCTWENVSDNVKYFGSTLSSANSSVHIDGRIKAVQNAFYALQGGGLKFNTVSPMTALNVYNTAVKSVLLFGCNAIHLNSGHISNLEKLQTYKMFIRYWILYTYHPYFESYRYNDSVRLNWDCSNWTPLFVCFSDSQTSHFYLYLIKENNSKIL